MLPSDSPALQPDDLEDLGFDAIGGAYFKRYREYRIDMLTCLSGAWRIELRGGSMAARIEGVIETREELEVLLRILDRAK